MKVKELMLLLIEHHPEREVLIQQGEAYDYMVAHSVQEKEVLIEDFGDKPQKVVVIKYT